MLGLDISSISTGWAVLTDGPALVDSGRLEFSAKKSVKERLVLFSSLLTQLMGNYQPFDYVVIEDTFFLKNVATTKLLNKFSGVAIYTAYSKLGDKTAIAVLVPASIRSVISSDVRKYTASMGSTKVTKTIDKDEVFDYIKSKYGLNSFTFKKDNDITDAIAAATYPFKKTVDPSWIL